MNSKGSSNIFSEELFPRVSKLPKYIYICTYFICEADELKKGRQK